MTSFTRSRFISWGAILALGACTGSKDDTGDTGDTGSTDTSDTGQVDTEDSGDSGDSGDSADTGDTGIPPEGNSVLLGRVTDGDGTTLEGVAVTLDSGESTQTGASGLFRIDGLGNGDGESVKAIATFDKQGYMSGVRVFRGLDDSEHTWQVSMIARAAGQTFDTEDTNPVQLTLGSTGGLTIQPGTLVDSSGAAATGQATAYLTMIEVDEDAALRAAPGDFGAELEDGSSAWLESWGMAEILVVAADGSELQLASGSTAELEVPLVLPRIGREPMGGDTVPFFWFDESTGLWMQDGEAVNSESGNPIGTIDHFDHWNVDIAMETTCVLVKVEDTTGSPRPDLQVEAMGLDYTNYQDYFSDASGNAYMLVRRDSQLQLTVFDESAISLATTSVNTPNTIGDCQSLLDAGTLETVHVFAF